MTFDDWMRSVNPRHQPTDDGMETRLLRKCWDAAKSAERKRCADLCRRVADETRNTEVARIAGRMLANWIITGNTMDTDPEIAQRDSDTRSGMIAGDALAGGA